MVAIEPWDRPNDVVLATNRATSPSFELGVGDWQSRWSNHSSVTRTTSSWAVVSGSYALQINGTDVSNGASSWIYEDHDVTGGEWVAIAANMRCQSATPLSAQFVMYSYDSSGAVLSSDFSNPKFALNSDRAQYEYNRYQLGSSQAPAGAVRVRVGIFFRGVDGSSDPPPNFTAHMDDVAVSTAGTRSVVLDAVASYFDGDTPDGETDDDPHYRWTGTPHASPSEKYLPARPLATGVFEIGASTDARLGMVADVYSRSQEKIKLELAGVDRELIAGERVELDAAALTAAETVWHWRQITGPTVEINQQDASIDFIAPDVDDPTPVRIGVYAASEDGRNRSDWHYFDLTIQPPFLRLRDDSDGTFAPSSPKYVGYDRGKREIWNDVIAPPTFVSNPRKGVEEIDLGILPDDVQFTDGEPPAQAAAGGIYVDINTGDYYLNFGAGYNETDDTTAAPRTNAWWVNPATGDILEWIED